MHDLNEKPVKICQIQGCHTQKKLLPAIVVRPALVEIIRSEMGSWNEAGYICEEHLRDYRTRYIEGLFAREIGEISSLERAVISSMQDHEILSTNPDAQFAVPSTFGGRLADQITNFGGSWYFIGLFVFFIIIWMFGNAAFLSSQPFDPYPFILLNLALSCLAAIQAPVILMSQKRQEQRDRARALDEYKVNLKAELEIRHLHQKIDHLLTNQWQRLFEIQELQIDLINELKSKKRSS